MHNLSMDMTDTIIAAIYVLYHNSQIKLLLELVIMYLFCLLFIVAVVDLVFRGWEFVYWMVLYTDPTVVLIPADTYFVKSKSRVRIYPVTYRSSISSSYTPLSVGVSFLSLLIATLGLSSRDQSIYHMVTGHIHTPFCWVVVVPPDYPVQISAISAQC